MTSEMQPGYRRDRAKELFAQAIEIDRGERESWLERACADDGPLLAELRRLVRAHDSAGEFLAEPTRPGQGGIEEEGSGHTVEDAPGTRLGPYELREPLGEGGFGVVHRARQHEPIRREVAVKILRWTATSERVIARFDQERQALASLDHPHIAHILDAGRTVDGRPYFVMELVDGPSVTVYCDRRCLSVPDRLLLFVQICRAVQHAHEKGIVHRDLKAGNVLVTERAGRPVPKVIDFGIAKVSQVGLEESVVHTEAGVLMGSLETMSPEQAERGAIALDTRSDVYSLGVLLYELLCGCPPFDFGSSAEFGLSEILRKIGHVNPPPPSKRIPRDPAEAGEVARARATQPQRLARSLRGDLDRIVAKAIEKDRDRRYASAEALASDVERFLRCEPVRAVPPGETYRLRKLVRRHPGASALLVILAVSLLGGTSILAWQARSVSRARDQARREATLSAAEAAAFRSAAFEDVDSYVARARHTLGLVRANPDLSAGDRALRLVNTVQILDLQEGFGDVSTASLLFRDEVERDALSSLRAATDGADSSVLRTVDLLLDHFARTNPDRMEEPLRLAVEIAFAARSVDPERPAAARRRLDLWIQRAAAADLESGQPARAEARARESLQLWRLSHPGGSGNELRAAGLLGRALVAQGRYLEAEPFLQQSHRAHPSLSVARALSEVWRSQGQGDAARLLESAVPVAAARELGPVVLPVPIGGCDLGFSTEFGGRSVWVFGDTFTRAGQPEGAWRAVTNSWAWTELAPIGGPRRLRFAVAEDGAPRALIPLLTDEVAPSPASDLAAPTPRFAIWPEAIVGLPGADDRLIAYSKVRLGPKGGLDLETVGGGWAIWDHPDSAARRVVARPGHSEPTLHFSSPEPAFGAGALVHEGNLYAYSVQCADLRCPALLARVSVGSWQDPKAWEYFAGEDRWSGRWEDAVEVMDSAPQLSVYWNDYVGRFVAVYAVPFDGAIEVRLADRPEGPWSIPWRVLDTVQPPSLEAWSYGVILHPELAAEGGRRDLFSYYRQILGITGEIRLVEIDWAASTRSTAGLTSLE